MKKVLITSLAILSASLVFAQKGKPKQDIPKQHVFYDTVKVVKERVDFSVDTIPVYFKELKIIKGFVQDIYNSTKESKVSEKRDTSYVEETWKKGYVIWQTYRKMETGLISNYGGFYTNNTITTNYYKQEYEPSELRKGIYLYEDKKTKCNCMVSMSILR